MRSAASRFASRASAILTVLISLGALAQVPATNSPSTTPAGSGQGAANQQVPSDPNAAQQPPAQEPISPEPGGGDQGSMFVFKRQVEEVVLHATVVDEQRRLVSDLDRSKFAVLDGGVPQAITSFRREDVPVAMGI